jgi:hypothetical protein
MDRIKKVIAVVLLFIFLYNLSGYYFAFSIQKTGNREAVENLIKVNGLNDLLLIKVAAADEKKIEWENSGEFNLNGKMYDVAFKKQAGNILYIYCYQDAKEDHLFASLDLQVKNNIDNTASEKSSKNIVKNPLTDYLANYNSNRFHFIIYSLRHEIKSDFLLPDFFIDTAFHPPKVA